MVNAYEDAVSPTQSRDYETLSGLLTSERLGSYLRWSDSNLKAAFSLYEWNMTASAAVTHTTGMVEAAHHEPVHRRDLSRDLSAAVEVTSWAHETAGDWVGDLSTITDVLAQRPPRPGTQCTPRPWPWELCSPRRPPHLVDMRF